MRKGNRARQRAENGNRADAVISKTLLYLRVFFACRWHNLINSPALVALCAPLERRLLYASLQGIIRPIAQRQRLAPGIGAEKWRSGGDRRGGDSTRAEQTFVTSAQASIMKALRAHRAAQTPSVGRRRGAPAQATGESSM